MITHPSSSEDRCHAKRYPPEFRRKALDLVASGRRVAQVAGEVDISEQCIYLWRRQYLIDSGQLPGVTSTDHAELVATRRAAWTTAGRGLGDRGLSGTCGTLRP